MDVLYDALSLRLDIGNVQLKQMKSQTWRDNVWDFLIPRKRVDLISTPCYN